MWTSLSGISFAKPLNWAWSINPRPRYSTWPHDVRGSIACRGNSGLGLWRLSGALLLCTLNWGEETGTTHEPNPCRSR
jgi:hypothetical protein